MTVDQALLAVLFSCAGFIAGLLAGIGRLTQLIEERNKWRNLANLMNQRQDWEDTEAVKLIPKGYSAENIEDLAEFLGR